MRKILFLAVVILAFAGCETAKDYKVTGNVVGLEGMVYMLDEYGYEMDSAEVKDGKFIFTGNADEITPVLLSDEHEVFAMLFLENGRIKVTGDIAEGNIEITGTLSNDRSTEFDRNYYAFVEDFINSNENPDLNIFTEENVRLSEETIENNKDNFFGIYKLSELERSWDSDRILKKLAEFPQELQNTSYARKIADNARLKKRTEAGQQYTQITLADRNGKKFSLSSYVGEDKYVLIDFWASWCAPCMQEIPYLKEVYAKYSRNGFEIFGISMDRDREAWINAVDEQGMNWVQVFHEADSEAASDYSIVSIPANFLVGPDGTIIARDLRGEVLETTLAGLIQ